jgi:hypothetical protein
VTKSGVISAIFSAIFLAPSLVYASRLSTHTPTLSSPLRHRPAATAKPSIACGSTVTRDTGSIFHLQLVDCFDVSMDSGLYSRLRLRDHGGGYYPYFRLDY